MRRVTLRVDAARVEDVLDVLLPRLFDGVHERLDGDDCVELVAYARTRPLPPLAELERLCGEAVVAGEDGDAPDDWRERRRLGGGGVLVGGRVWLRSPVDSPAPAGAIDVVLERTSAFGTGAHPTTRMCLELLLGVGASGAFADLGCGAGALAIAAAKLGFAPVEAVDVSSESVATAAANAERNRVEIRVGGADLLSEPPPAAAVAAANVPLAVHRALATRLPAELRLLIASGVHAEEAPALINLYRPRGFAPRASLNEKGWAAVVFERRDE